MPPRSSGTQAAEAVHKTPSEEDGFTKAMETAWRRRYCFLIDRAARSLPVGFAQIQTAMSYCHSFFQARSMAKNDPMVVATAALYLACKVEEHPKPIAAVAEAVFSVAHRHKRKALEMLRNKDFAAKLKEKVLMAERGLLYVIGFEFEIEHPTQLALDFLQTNYNLLLPEAARVPQQQWLRECAEQSGPAYDVLNQLSGIAWNLCMSSYQMLTYLHYKPRHVAAAAIYVAVHIMGLQPVPLDGWHWFEVEPLEISFELLKEITRHLLDVCEGSRVGAERPMPAGRPDADERPEAAYAAAAAARQVANLANVPGSDPRSEQSEQTLQVSPAVKLTAPSSQLGQTVVPPTNK